MFAVICVPDFALQAMLRREPVIGPHEVTEEADCKPAPPIALIDSSPANISKALVLECTEAAKTAGVCAGLTAPQAMARCSELILKCRSPAVEQEAANILLQTAYAFTPHIENTGPGVCTLDLRGLGFGSSQSSDIPTDCGLRSSDCRLLEKDGAQRSFGFLQETESCSVSSPAAIRGESHTLLIEWAEKILAALRQLNLRAQIGIAATPNLALLAGQAAKPLLLVEDAEEFFTHLPVEALAPLPQVLGILKRWGVHTARAFLALGKDAIAERLGAEALELFQRASTNTIRPLNIITPPDTFEEQMDFEIQIETLEPLLFVLRRFVEQLATRIMLTYRVVAELRLTLTLESGTPYEHAFKVPAPTANVETLFRMLHTHLDNLRTDAPITSLRISAAPTQAETQQFGLFESALRDPNHFHETLARLTALLGVERVGAPIVQPSHHPDVFRMQTPDFAQSHSVNSAEEARNQCSLCLRRFRPAILADVELKDGRPAFISSLRVNGRIVKKPRGPWRISGTWWDQRRWVRQEWDVEMSDGTVYRLFHANGNLSVEGVYD